MIQVMVQNVHLSSSLIKNTATQVNSRKYFAEWIVSPDNPMFTKTIVNRLWHRVMGAPLIGENLDITPEEFGKNPNLTQIPHQNHERSEIRSKDVYETHL